MAQPQTQTVTVRLDRDEYEALVEAAERQGETPAGYMRAGACPRPRRPAGRGRRLGVLIDADNAQASLLAAMLATVAEHGAVALRRVYGDWSAARLCHWRPSIREHALHAVHQFPSVSGKNSTDIALVIDAMDLLHGGTLDGLCIVSSDSDFAPLATRIREHGLLAMGIGRRDTPRAFVEACDVFVCTDTLAAVSGVEDPAPVVALSWPEMVADAARAVQQEDGWALLSRVGDLLQQRDPTFDPRSYGAAGGRLSLLVQLQPAMFELADPDGGGQLKVRVLSNGDVGTEADAPAGAAA